MAVGEHKAIAVDLMRGGEENTTGEQGGRECEKGGREPNEPKEGTYPGGVLGVKIHEVAPQDVGDGRHAEGHACTNGKRGGGGKVRKKGKE